MSAGWRRGEAVCSARCSTACARKRCFFHQDPVNSRGRGPLRLGDDWRTLLRRAGQPQQRTQAWSWYVSVVRGRRVRAVAVTTASLAGRPNALRKAVGRVLSAKAITAPRAFVPNPAQAKGQVQVQRT